MIKLKIRSSKLNCTFRSVPIEEGREGRSIPPCEVIMLVERFRHKDLTRHCEAAEALYQLGPEAASAAPALSTFLQNERNDPQRRLNAAKVLGQIRPADERTVAALCEILRSEPDKYIRGVAAVVLGDVGALTKNPAAVFKVLYAAANEDRLRYVRSHADMALARLAKVTTQRR